MLIWVLAVAVAAYFVLGRRAGTGAPSSVPTAGDFFPIGLYCVEDPEDFREIAAAGFNLVQGYRFEGAYPDRYPNTNAAARAYLDAAQAAGLRVLMGISQDAVRERNLIALRERPLALKDHPALFGWQLYDEPESAMYDPQTQRPVGPALPPGNLRWAYQEIKRLDPTHPVSIATSVTIDAKYPYADGADILMPDYFPIPLGTLEDFAVNLEAAVRVLTPRGKSVIPHIQVYNVARDRLVWPADRPISEGRYPTLEEIRFMAHAAVNRGAKGVVFNCYRFDYGEGLVGDDISRANNPSQWRIVAAVASELQSMIPVLLARAVGRR